ncbi:MAG: hypothetical protein R3F59_06290 [Myxococcota bacterium]
MAEPTHIRVRNARAHNLKGVDVDVPRHQLVVFTGVSGSGKSSLAYDTIFKEQQPLHPLRHARPPRPPGQDPATPDILADLGALDPACPTSGASAPTRPSSSSAPLPPAAAYFGYASYLATRPDAGFPSSRASARR